MPRLRPLAYAILLLPALGACTGNRSLYSQHQPIVENGAAHVVGCPDWSDSAVNAGESTSANYGCATAANLAAMIADPNDLIHGKSGDADDGTLASRAVRSQAASKAASTSTSTSTSTGAAPVAVAQAAGPTGARR